MIMANNRGVASHKRTCSELRSTLASPGISRATELRGRPPPSSSPFLFINTHDKNGKQKAESRMLVRSHVMSSFYRKKSSPQIQKETSPRDVETGGQTSRFRLGTYPQKRKSKQRKDRLHIDSQIVKEESPEIVLKLPKNFHGSGPWDPFAAAALPWDRNLQSLVYHCTPQRSPFNISELCVLLTDHVRS